MRAIRRRLGKLLKGNEPEVEEQVPVLSAEDKALVNAALRSTTAAHAMLGEQGPCRLPVDEIQIPHQEMWKPGDDVILNSTQDIIKALEDYDEHGLSDHSEKTLDREFMARYLYQTNVRIANLADVFQARLQPGATILEIGSFFGSFSLALQRLGYQVTAIDRYDSFFGRFDKHVAMMEKDGVQVIRANRENEDRMVAELPQFDAVITMAVVEHIPHTPKGFLEMCKSKVKSGGWLALDTPNLLRHWNRVHLSQNKSIFQDIESQYYCEPPWEGHHREFTPQEMEWMLEQIGCSEIDLQLFDYNLLQFQAIDKPHISALEGMINDPNLADTILVTGRC